MQERSNESVEATAKQVSMFILQNFYIKPYDRSQDFYVQYEERMEQAKLIFHNWLIKWQMLYFRRI